LEFVFSTGAYAEKGIGNKLKVILLDLKLPKVDGLDVLRKIKSDERTKATPIVVLTSSAEDRDIVESYALGVNSYIVKTANFDKFLDAVSEIGLYWLLFNKPLSKSTTDERRGQGTMDRCWHKRVSLTGSGILKFEKNGNIQSIQTILCNISLGGIGLYADVPIEIDTNVSITINFMSAGGIKTDSVEGCVVYYKDMGNIYFMGIQFNEEINPENQPSLYEHIQKILNMG